MITKLAKSDTIETPWKNGGGTTRQIEIWPPGSTLLENNFSYRLSSATVGTNGPFSLFPGMKRYLIIWQGQGIKLNQKEVLLPATPYQFNGDDTIECELLQGQVIDVGLIFDPKKVSSDLEVIKIDQHKKVALLSGVHFLFLAAGKSMVNSILINEGDTLRVELSKKEELSIESTEGPLVFFHFKINTVRG